MGPEAFAWREQPALIEHLFPVQKISAESFKEQMAGAGKTLTGLGSYWKGRKPLILAKAVILGALLPATKDHLGDLEIFELLMAMDPQAMYQRIAANLPASQREKAKAYLMLSFNEQVRAGKRAEEMGEALLLPIWDRVNRHLGTSASSLPELIGQMGIARFGRRPKVADVFAGSGQIPFEAARLGCDVYASDLNPVACMLTWGGLILSGLLQKKDWKSLTSIRP